MASSATVGSAVIKLSFDGKGVKADLDDVEKETEKKASGMASKIGGIMKTAAVGIGAAFTGATAAVGGLVKSASSSFADAEQLWGGVETLFKDSADIVIANANKAYETAGMSANQYMETVTGFSASLLQSLGGDTVQAAEVANMAVIDMADNANKMGTAMESIQFAYQGFAKQNYTMLDNLKLGYGGTKEEMERLLADATKLTGMKYDISNLSDVYKAIHAVQVELGISGMTAEEAAAAVANGTMTEEEAFQKMGTTAKEAKETISGSFGMMKASWSNLLTGIADDTQDFDKLVGNFVNSASTFGDNILPTIEVALKGVSSLVGKLGPMIIEKIPELADELIPALIDTSGTIVQSLITIFPSLLTTLINSIIAYIPTLVNMLTTMIPQIISQLFSGVVQVIRGITQMIPQILPQIVNMLIQVVNMLTQPSSLQMLLQAGIELFMELVHAIPQMLTALASAMPEIIMNIVEFLTSPSSISMILHGAFDLFMAIVQAVPQILGSLIGAFGSLVGNLWNWITSTFQGFAANFGNIISGAFRGAINGVLAFIEGFVNGPIDVINGFVDAINAAFGAIGVNIGGIPRVSLPRLARGGVVDSATAAVIGEAGREAVLPLENNTGNWAGLLAETLAIEMEDQGDERPINIYMTNEINNDMDVQDMLRRITQEIRRAV